MAFHVYDGRRTVYEILDDARAHAQATIDECRKQATQYEWPDMVSEIAVYEAPDDCGEPWRDGTLVLEARERVIEDEDHPLGKFSEFDLVEVGSKRTHLDNEMDEFDPSSLIEVGEKIANMADAVASKPGASARSGFDINGITFDVVVTVRPIGGEDGRAS